jgi:hypothetical protein
MIKIFFSVIFFKFFQVSKYIGNVDDDAYAFKSTAILSLFVSFNIWTLISYFKDVLGLGLPLFI